MIRYIHADELHLHPRLAASMFRDRATQFRDRLNWDVTVDRYGFERDEYDDVNPLYVIWEQPDGTHGGSMRFLPTIGRTMVNDHFRALTDDVRIESPLIWECTRFCLAPGAGSAISASMMLAGGEILRGFDLMNFVGVFDARMIRVYKILGGEPEILGMSGTGPDAIGVGLWAFTETAETRLLARAGITAARSQAWFKAAFEPAVEQPLCAAV